MPVKSFKARASGLIGCSINNGFKGLASVASTFFKINKNRRYIKVFEFTLAPLVCLHRSSEILNIKTALPVFMQCYVATKSQKGNYAFT